MLSQENTVRGKRKEKEKQQAGAEGPLENADERQSPFAAISATMGWETFHTVQMLWLNVIDLPTSSKEKDWSIQVDSSRT